MKALQKIFGMISLAAVLFIAATAVAAPYDGTIQGYASDTPLDNGTVVQLDVSSNKTVKVARQSELQNMYGVTLDRTQVPLTITNENLKNEVFVATSGTHYVKVSTQGGPIATGDYLTLSSVNGIAMKAGTEEKTVLGRAGAPFTEESVVLGETVLKDTNGKETKKVAIGSIPVTVAIQRNPNQKTTKAKVPEVLERVGQAIAEKEVSAVRIYLSLGITAVSIIAAIALLYAGVRNGVISIGRNPMSKKSIFRALLEVVLTSALILIIGLFAVYLLLKL